MIFNTNIPVTDKALMCATLWHKDQVRKRTGLPYIVHPISVTKRVQSVKSNLITQDVIAASYLHDVIEDCGITSIVLTNIFNSNVSAIVQELTAPKFDTNPEKDDYILNSMIGMSSEAFIVKMCDRLDNVDDASKSGWHKYLSRTKRIMDKLVKSRKIPSYLLSVYNDIMYYVQGF